MQDLDAFEKLGGATAFTPQIILTLHVFLDPIFVGNVCAVLGFTHSPHPVQYCYMCRWKQALNVGPQSAQ